MIHDKSKKMCQINNKNVLLAFEKKFKYHRRERWNRNGTEELAIQYRLEMCRHQFCWIEKGARSFESTDYTVEIE